MRTILFVALFVHGHICLFGQTTDVFSLSESIQYANENSSVVKTSNLQIESAKAQVLEYKSIGIPKANIGVDYNYYLQLPTQLIPADAFLLPGMPPPQDKYLEAQFGTKNNLNLSFNLNTLIFDGSYFVGLRAANGLLRLTRKQAEYEQYEIKDQITKAYLAVLLVEESNLIIDRNINNLLSLFEETNALWQNGLVERLDVDRLSLSLSNLNQEKEILQRQLDLAKTALKFQMNYPLEANITLSDSLESLLVSITDRSADGLDINNRLEKQIMDQNLYLNELNTKRFKAGYVPTLRAFALHQQTLQRDDLFDGDAPGFFPATILGVQLNVPVFDGMEKTAKIRKSKIDEELIKIQISDFERSVELQVRNAKTNLSNAKARLATQKENETLAQKILNTTMIKYKEGVGSSLEISQAEQELYRTQSAKITALYELIVAKTELEKALGY